MKNKRLISTLLLLFTLCFIPIDTNAQSYPDTNVIVYDNSHSEKSNGTTTYANDVRWMYKIVNGVLYRRKYDFTTERWIGEWERVN